MKRGLQACSSGMQISVGCSKVMKSLRQKIKDVSETNLNVIDVWMACINQQCAAGLGFFSFSESRVGQI